MVGKSEKKRSITFFHSGACAAGPGPDRHAEYFEEEVIAGV
jgi:hypothetical protein